MTKAFDADQIDKRNLQAIEEVIASSVQAYIRKSHPRLQTLLHEEVEIDSLGQPCMRELPIPQDTEWHHKDGLMPCKRSRLLSNIKGGHYFLNEIEQIRALPNELQKEEVDSLHAVLFCKKDSST